jgi:GT2 family glycosyltransferase
VHHVGPAVAHVTAQRGGVAGAEAALDEPAEQRRHRDARRAQRRLEHAADRAGHLDGGAAGVEGEREVDHVALRPAAVERVDDEQHARTRQARLRAGGGRADAGLVDLSIVLPTYRRAEAIAVTLPPLLRLEGVGEIVVVDDGSHDETYAVVAACDDSRLRFVRHAENRGAPAARNTGVRTARGTWVVFAEDDCRFPPDYARVLREEALRHDAGVVGAPMVHPRPGESVGAAVARLRTEATGANGLDELAGFPAGGGVVETPLVPATALVRRDVALAIGFDEGFRGNAYREETDFFVRAARAGVRCLLTGRTYFWEPGRWGGGQTRPRLATELWTLRGNWRFLRRHGDWLGEQGFIRSPAREQAAFTARRARRLAAEARSRSTLPAG